VLGVSWVTGIDLRHCFSPFLLSFFFCIGCTAHACLRTRTQTHSVSSTNPHPCNPCIPRSSPRSLLFPLCLSLPPLFSRSRNAVPILSLSLNLFSLPPFCFAFVCMRTCSSCACFCVYVYARLYVCACVCMCMCMYAYMHVCGISPGLHPNLLRLIPEQAWGTWGAFTV